eukprot:CAMPEP_0196651786 /NCGR_PEP_ID=MMETSP1086-20130531/878_1 /TAXON_ID=77921 /ORGANISM="Cyanoptyche  gloeocystis , Strain SAG4.97" /LENGTH=49 /DNA_ID=CAMNT_0041981987 /DNA_START=219 /DNA_END=368 /DNA_ORIENTATION=+
MSYERATNEESKANKSGKSEGLREGRTFRTVNAEKGDIPPKVSLATNSP